MNNLTYETIVDAGGLFFNYAIRRDQWHRDSALFTRMLGVCLADESKTSVRRDFYLEYKQHRAWAKKTPKQQEYAQRAYELWKETKANQAFTFLQWNGYEADDLLAWFGLAGMIVVSLDKDLLQLADQVSIRDMFDNNRWEKHRRMGPDSYKDIPYTANSILLYLTLYGDATDNVPRLVPKGAKAIRHFKTLFMLPNPWTHIEDYIDRAAILRNLALVVLPHPSLFDISSADVLQLLKDGEWNTFRKSYVQEHIKSTMDYRTI